jgi:hypothetical protein
MEIIVTTNLVVEEKETKTLNRKFYRRWNSPTAREKQRQPLSNL